jgi:hypothetical protein
VCDRRNRRAAGRGPPRPPARRGKAGPPRWPPRGGTATGIRPSSERTAVGGAARGGRVRPGREVGPVPAHAEGARGVQAVQGLDQAAAVGLGRAPRAGAFEHLGEVRPADVGHAQQAKAGGRGRRGSSGSARCAYAARGPGPGARRPGPWRPSTPPGGRPGRSARPGRPGRTPPGPAPRRCGSRPASRRDAGTSGGPGSAEPLRRGCGSPPGDGPTPGVEAGSPRKNEKPSDLSGPAIEDSGPGPEGARSHPSKGGPVVSSQAARGRFGHGVGPGGAAFRGAGAAGPAPCRAGPAIRTRGL